MSNPPAFPLHNHGAQTLGLHVTGMTLQDYFAAKAMQSLLSRLDIDEVPTTGSNQFTSICLISYFVAIEMMKAREA